MGSGGRRAHPPWEDSYTEGTPPWDIGRPQDAVVRLCDAGAFTGPALDAGCGTGENTLEVAARGVEIAGVDVAPTAIELARQKAAARGLPAGFQVGDALRLDRLGLTFRTVLDCGLFHTFDDDDRALYVDSLAGVTVPGSVLQLLCFSDLEPGDWGPRRVSQAELREAFRTGWRVVSIEADRFDTNLGSTGVAAWRAAIERV